MVLTLISIAREPGEFLGKSDTDFGEQRTGSADCAGLQERARGRPFPVVASPEAVLMVDIVATGYSRLPAFTKPQPGASRKPAQSLSSLLAVLSRPWTVPIEKPMNLLHRKPLPVLTSPCSYPQCETSACSQWPSSHNPKNLSPSLAFPMFPPIISGIYGLLIHPMNAYWSKLKRHTSPPSATLL